MQENRIPQEKENALPDNESEKKYPETTWEARQRREQFLKELKQLVENNIIDDSTFAKMFYGSGSGNEALKIYFLTTGNVPTDWLKKLNYLLSPKAAIANKDKREVIKTLLQKAFGIDE